MHLTTHAFQLGEPVEHRGIVVAPLFPTVDPVAAYITLDEALPPGLRITETVRRGLGARARRRQPTRRRTSSSTTARSSSARSRTGSST